MNRYEREEMRGRRSAQSEGGDTAPRRSAQGNTRGSARRTAQESARGSVRRTAQERTRGAARRNDQEFEYTGSQPTGQRKNENRRKAPKKRKGNGGTLILLLLIALVIGAILFFLKDSLRVDLPFLNSSKRVLSQAEEYAQKYDYDGAIAVLQGNERYATSEELQARAAEYENAKTAMNADLDAVMASAQEQAGDFDYLAAIETLKASPYYNVNAALQQKAAEYEEAEEHKGEVDAETLAEADRLSAMYDYDGAIALLKNTAAYESNPMLQELVSGYEAEKAACVPIDPENVTHIFYHSLVVDPSKAFVPGAPGYDGWQQWMTTVSEFDKITQSMYDRGYVLVSIYDLFNKETAEDGTVTITPNQIMLPEGKKAYVMSLDDLSYYHTYDDHGVASKIVLDEQGKPTCEYIEDDGTVSYGDYDVVPRLDTFIEEHPDASYRGAKGIIALTGYDGILGYRTDGAYSEEHNTNTDKYFAEGLQLDWLAEHPDFDWEQECAEAKKVAEAMKADGWTFANHTWGHQAVGRASYETLVADTERWMQYVSPLIGGTDAIIFAHGEDISPTGTYDSTNEKYNYLKSQGFDVYCNVDSTPYTTTITSDYVHQGRRNLDGYRIWQDYISDSPMAGDLFNAAEVLDPERPQPVPDL